MLYFTILLLILFAFYFLLIIFCVLLKDILDEIELHNRPFNSNLVWLILIPLFNIYWSYHINPKISKAIQKQLEENEKPETGDSGSLLGKAYPLLLAATFVFWLASIQLLLILSSIICLLMYWSKMSEYYQKLKDTRMTKDYFRSADNNNPDLLD